MTADLPKFRYHPDPIASGSIERSDQECEVCEKARGYRYTGPAYCTDEVECICPWCIADGAATNMFGVEFTDCEGVGGYGDWEQVPQDVVDEVSCRTPGFNGWQQERWFTCCKDAAIFLGLAGKIELLAFGEQAVAAIRAESGYESDEWGAYFSALHREDGPTAYVFRCLHCGKFGGYSDCH